MPLGKRIITQGVSFEFDRGDFVGYVNKHLGDLFMWVSFSLSFSTPVA